MCQNMHVMHSVYVLMLLCISLSIPYVCWFVICAAACCCFEQTEIQYRKADDVELWQGSRVKYSTRKRNAVWKWAVLVLWFNTCSNSIPSLLYFNDFCLEMQLMAHVHESSHISNELFWLCPNCESSGLRPENLGQWSHSNVKHLHQTKWAYFILQEHEPHSLMTSSYTVGFVFLAGSGSY